MKKSLAIVAVLAVMLEQAISQGLIPLEYMHIVAPAVLILAALKRVPTQEKLTDSTGE